MQNLIKPFGALFNLQLPLAIHKSHRPYVWDVDRVHRLNRYLFLWKPFFYYIRRSKLLIPFYKILFIKIENLNELYAIFGLAKYAIL